MKINTMMNLFRKCQYLSFAEKINVAAISLFIPFAVSTGSRAE